MEPFSWPAGYGSAVSLKFDDGLESHLLEAVPLLNAHGFAGTFYVCPAGSRDEWQRRAERWQKARQGGHEIGNHTLSHPIPKALEDGPGWPVYEELTLDAYGADVLEAQRRLEAAFDQADWSFCYPCYQTHVGAGRSCRSVIPFIAEHFLAACVGGEISKPFNRPECCDLHALMSVPADPLTKTQLIGKIERSASMGRWIIITFHDIGEGRLSTSRSDFEAVLDHLSDRRDEMWVAPVVEVAKYVLACR